MKSTSSSVTKIQSKPKRCLRSKSAPSDLDFKVAAPTENAELARKSLMFEQSQKENRKLVAKIESMQIEWRAQQEHLGKLHQEYTRLQHILGQHSVYCANLGATMASLLWKVSRMEGTVENLLEGSRLSELVTIMDNSIKAFIEVFGNDIPDRNGNEYQLILSWCGILTNITAISSGRYFLVNHMEGQNLINQLIPAIPKFESVNGLLLQRMILMVIHNLSLDESTGIPFLQSNSKLPSVLRKILHKAEPEIKDLVYKIMYSLTQNFRSVQYLEHLKDTLPLVEIESEASDTLSTYHTYANKILENVGQVINVNKKNQCKHTFYSKNRK